MLIGMNIMPPDIIPSPYFLIFSVEEEPTWRREGLPKALVRLDTVSVF
jgi:hypothetical protein